MAGEQTVSGRITWKQQAGSVLQQRKIFRSSLTTRQSHFIWPGGCGQRMDTFPTVEAVVRLSPAPCRTFSISLTHLTLWNIFPPFVFHPLSSSRYFVASCPVSFFLISSLATLPHHVFVCVCVCPTLPSSNILIPPSLTLFLFLFVVSHT